MLESAGFRLAPGPWALGTFMSSHRQIDMCLRAGSRSRPVLARALASAILLGLAALLPSPAAAIVYVMPKDEAMVARSPVIVFGEVRAAEPGPFGERLSTDYLLRVEEVLKGFVPGSMIVVRQPGGRGPDGVAGAILGLPRLAEGDRMLLFLEPEGGVFRLVEFALGMFFEAQVGGRTLLLRESSMLEEVPGSRSVSAGAGQPARRARDGGRFRRWVADRAAGSESPADYFEAELEADLVAVGSPFQLLRTPAACEASGGRSGLPIRWRRVDRGESVGFLVQAGGQPGVPGGGLTQVLAAMRAWNQNPGSRANLITLGQSNRELPVSEDDEINSITYEDPLDEIPGTYVLGQGGVIAINYALFFCSSETPPHPIPGNARVEAYEIIESNLTTQDGYRDWVASRSNPRRAHEEIMAHELGHGLGIGHTCGPNSGPCDSDAKNEALMRAFGHGDGRGAALKRDDRTAVRFLYPALGPAPSGPAAPSDLTATAISQTELELRWLDRSGDENAFEVYERMIDGDFQRIQTLDRNTTSLVVQNVPPATYRAYEVVARNNRGSSAPTPEAGATTFAEVAECVEGEGTLCLNEGRFRIEARWESTHDGGDGRAQSLTNDTGDFWFFNPDNIEIVVKVLDGCAINQRYWVFAGGLTDVKVIMTVIDSDTGIAATYYNPPGTAFLPVQDTDSLAVCTQGQNLYGESRYLLSPDEMDNVRGGAAMSSASSLGRSAGALLPVGLGLAQHGDGSCEADNETLCLGSGHFSVRASWETADRSGEARAWPLTADTGLYWFFEPSNLEMVIKVLDGCAMNGHRWVFAGGLTDVRVTMTVSDSETGEERTYENPPGTPFQPVQDLMAFSCENP